jgi:3'(2'), 5'-bisphosphate nucleotidase
LTLTVTAALVDTVRDIAVRAGVEILKIYNSDFAIQHKDDASPVTEADHRAEEIIIAAIRAEITDKVPFVAEETAAAGDIPVVGDQPFWLIDPLDGTKQFIKRQGEFTVNIALIADGRPQLGVVHAPAINATYWASENGAFAVVDDGPAHAIACRPFPDKGVIAVASRSHRNPETEAFLARYDVAEVISSGSSIKFCLIAAGRADLYPRTGRTMEWDTAAGHAVVRFAGGSVTDMAGRELLYGKPGFENPHFVVKGAERTP